MHRFVAVVLFSTVFFPGPPPVAAQPAPRPPAASPAARPSCDDTAVLQVRALGRQALAEAVAGNDTEADRNVRAARAVAARLGCASHRVMATVHVVAGVTAHRAGHPAAAAAAWKKALALDPGARLPAALKDPALRAAFRTALARVVPRRATPRPLAGCTRDTHCKGERICEQGRCVYPPRRPALPPAGAVPPPRPSRHPARRYGTRNTVEIGGTLSFFWSEQDLEYEGEDPVSYSTTSFGIEAYVGWYPVRIFVLGAYFSLPVKREKREDATDATVNVDFGLTLAPGFAYPLVRRLYLYGEAHLGLEVQTSRTGSSSVSTVLGVFGAEVGLKVVLAPHWLLRAGIRPVYRDGEPRRDEGLGMITEGTFKNTRLEITLGFAGFL